MSFELTEDQKMMQKIARDFAEKEVAPGAEERDEHESFSRPLYDAMAGLGLTGICFPEQYGGADGDVLSYILAIEEISKADAGLGIALSATVSLCAWPIFAYGTEEQKQKYLKPLAEGEKMGAFGLTEPNAGTDVGGATTNAVKDGDFWVLNGTKVFNTNGGEAEIEVIFALTNKEAGPFKGMSAFIVEKGTPGLSFGKTEIKMGIRSSVQREVIMENVRVPAANLLGKEGEGFKIAMTALDGGRIGVAAQATGLAMGAIDAAVKYAKQRIQFGKPIITQQAISFMLAEMATETDAAHLLTMRAAYHKSEHLSYSKEAAMAKKFASDTAMEVTTNAVQIFGGYGYSREYPVEKMMRDAKITQIYEGTNQAQCMVIAGSVCR